MIPATIDGMVLDVPNKEGAFIVETSTFQSGTSLATLADMNDMILKDWWMNRKSANCGRAWNWCSMSAPGG